MFITNPHTAPKFPRPFNATYKCSSLKYILTYLAFSLIGICLCNGTTDRTTPSSSMIVLNPSGTFLLFAFLFCTCLYN